MTAERGLTPQQVEYLLRPLRADRVRVQDGQSYLPQQDVRAHLTRMFGFCGWSSHVVETALVHEAPTLRVDKRTGKRNPDRIDCLWRATVRLDVRDQHGNHLATYEDSATGDAQNSEPLAAHDLALKSAVSTALKRAATCLGDQFGLSLYNKGSLDAFVKGSLVAPPAEQQQVDDAPAATDEHDPDVTPGGQDADPPTTDEAPAHESAGSDPGQAAEAAVTARHQRRQEVNATRRGTPLRIAKARLWDALCETTPDPNTSPEQRNSLLEAECSRRGWNMPSLLSEEHLDILADHYEQVADDAIRSRYARGEA